MPDDNCWKYHEEFQWRKRFVVIGTVHIILADSYWWELMLYTSDLKSKWAVSIYQMCALTVHVQVGVLPSSSLLSWNTWLKCRSSIICSHFNQTELLVKALILRSTVITANKVFFSIVIINIGVIAWRCVWKVSLSVSLRKYSVWIPFKRLPGMVIDI